MTKFDNEKVELISKIIAMDDERFALFLNIIDRYDNEEYYDYNCLDKNGNKKDDKNEFE